MKPLRIDPLKAGVVCMALLLLATTTVYADALSNGLKEWDPSSIQGTIMDKGKGYIVIAEQYVYIYDMSFRGQQIRTRIMDGNGNEQDMADLKKGKYVLAKGGLAWDERLHTNVLMATEIFILDKPLNMKDEGQKKKYLEPAKPWE